MVPAFSDFEVTNLLLSQLWYKPKLYQENIRESYLMNWVEIEIDSWPLIPAYLEIEWKNIKEDEKTVKLLWFNMNDTTSINTEKVYKKYWIEISDIKELKF